MRKAKTAPEAQDAPEKEVKSETAAAADETSVQPQTKPIEKQITKVGHLLKEMRLQKGLKINEVAKTLCIRQCYLEAIENSDYKEIPVFPYGIGFIRSYADFLGLNSSNIIELYKEETNTKPANDIYVLEPQTEATVPNKKYLLISLIAIIAIYAAWSAYNRQAETMVDENISNEEVISSAQVEEIGSETPLIVEDYSATINNNDAHTAVVDVVAPVNTADQQVTITNESFVETPAAAPATKPAAETLAPQAPKAEKAVEKPAEKKMEVKTEAANTAIPNEGVFIKVKKEIWVEVKNDEKLYLSKVLKEGDTYTLPEGGHGMLLSLGKLDGADVYINGKLTTVATPAKRMNISMDKFLNADNH